MTFAAFPPPPSAAIERAAAPERHCRGASADRRGGFERIGLAIARVILVSVLAACAATGPDAPAKRTGGDAAPSPQSPFRAALENLGVAADLPAHEKTVLVNVPAFELVLLERGEPVLRSRVIVGSRGTPTPIIDTYATAVRFRPSWRPTPSMITSGEYADRRWPPGPNNPLGLAAIRLEPGLLVYLHDTNRRELFAREARALSHGCIRVQRWDEVIAWLLDADLDTVRRNAEGRRTFDEPTDPVPVLIRYYTTFPDDQGRLESFSDVYGSRAEKGAPGSSSSKAISSETCGLA